MDVIIVLKDIKPVVGKTSRPRYRGAGCMYLHQNFSTGHKKTFGAAEGLCGC